MNLHIRWKIKIVQGDQQNITNSLLKNNCDAIYNTADNPTVLYVYCSVKKHIKNIDNLIKDTPGMTLSSRKNLKECNWIHYSQMQIKPLDIGKSLRICPIWAKNDSTNRNTIIVNPGLAFGTGYHETTRLCMSIIEELAHTNQLINPILDIGTGTGILALTAWIFGARDITAFDNDQNCEYAIKDLLSINKTSLGNKQPFKYFTGSINDLDIEIKYNLIIVNIIPEVIKLLLPYIGNIIASNGLLITSGIRLEEQNKFLIELAINNFKPLKITREGDWIAILATFNNNDNK